MNRVEDAHETHGTLLSRWALGIAQGLILAALYWFGHQQLAMHDQLNELSWEMQQVRANAGVAAANKTAIERIGYRVEDLERRQAKDDEFRDKWRDSPAARGGRP